VHKCICGMLRQQSPSSAVWQCRRVRVSVQQEARQLLVLPPFPLHTHTHNPARLCGIWVACSSMTIYQACRAATETSHTLTLLAAVYSRLPTALGQPVSATFASEITSASDCVNLRFFSALLRRGASCGKTGIRQCRQLQPSPWVQVCYPQPAELCARAVRSRRSSCAAAGGPQLARRTPTHSITLSSRPMRTNSGVARAVRASAAAARSSLLPILELQLHRLPTLQVGNLCQQ
jgi:hypothetical protein